ncbi:PilZ domain-containing protein [Hyphomonas sp. WL0036]|uniref:PilZ domain-containing protein n=1 Tax=Hyphomonas sediminis TaxID=2866160 RepID=UPI001C7E2EF1|nr:PilZ domain-containing protein [Hyphomonas sediminis]MBY9068364.1 PilZ domain-containing protein [Hyphomonas sediminis]
MTQPRHQINHTPFMQYNRRGQRIRVEGKVYVRLGLFKRLECELRDISPGGARICLPEGVSLPDEFQMTLPQFKYPRTCMKRWQSGREIGVEFRMD